MTESMVLFDSELDALIALVYGGTGIGKSARIIAISCTPVDALDCTVPMLEVTTVS